MTSTTFIPGTTITSAWLNDVNTQTYGGTGGSIGTPFIQSGTGAIARTVQDKLRESVSVLDFYANGMSGVQVDPTGVVDSYLGIQAAITYATANGRSLYLPSGTYKCTSQLSITARLHLYGDGMWQSQIVYSGASSALKIVPPTARTSNTGYNLHDFGVVPAVAGTGTYAVEVVLGSLAYFSNFTIARLVTGDFGGYGIRLDNSIGNVDGFFTGTIQRCFIQNGINGDSIGDSITISENTIYGTRLTTPGLLLKGISGARQVVIRENNITTQSGAISLLFMEQAQVLCNQLEHPYSLNYTGVYAGQVYLGTCIKCKIEGNTIATNSPITRPSYAILLDVNSTQNVISKNDIDTGSTNYIAFGTGCTENMLKADNTYYFGVSPAQVESLGVNNIGINNYGVEVSLPLLNGWAQYAVDQYVTAKKSESGLIVLRGAIYNGTITPGTVLFTLPVGFRPARDKRFNVVNFNGAAFSSGTLLVQASTGNVLVLGAIANNLLQIDGIEFTLN